MREEGSGRESKKLTKLATRGNGFYMELVKC